jgi:hypothetical protein
MLHNCQVFKDPKMKSGSCLCKKVKFQYSGEAMGLGSCHCSKCRKVSGTGSNVVLIAPTRNFSWIEGENYIKSFRMEDGWVSTFCSECGSPLPQSNNEGVSMWVPAGVLDDNPELTILAHTQVASKAAWDSIPEGVLQYDDDYEPGA